LFGRENLSAFGRIPHIYPHIAQGAPNRQLQGFLAGLHEAFRQNAAAIPGGLNHFSRGAVLRHYYLASDLGEVLNDQLWHTPGVFL
jgi:hypothetical protein